MHLDEALGRFLLQLEADGRSPHTRNQYRSYVGMFIDWIQDVPAEAVTHELVAEFLAATKTRRRPDGGLRRASTMNVIRGCLRNFFRYLHQSGVVTENPARLLRRARCGRPLPRPLTEDEQARLLSVLNDAPERERLLFTVMLRTGIRIGSAVRLDVDDVDVPRSELRLRHAKGDREERIPVPSSLLEDLETFIADRDGPLFLARGRRRLSIRQAQRLFGRYAAAAEISSTRTHALRHTFATALYRDTSDVLLVQRALRHRSIQSTMVYAGADDRRLREALEA